MAKFIAGGMVGQISGSVGAQTFSRNRFGAYIRHRAVPVVSTTDKALAAKARLAAETANFRELTLAERIAWQVWADGNPITNTLGQSQTLTGHMAYVGINARRNLVDLARFDDPPTGPAPSAVDTLTLTADIGPGGVEIEFTPTPIGTNNSLWIQAAIADSASRNYVTNGLRFIELSDADEATEYDIKTAVETVLGTLQVGQVLHVFVAVYNRLNGLLSPPRRARATVVDTTP